MLVSSLADHHFLALVKLSQTWVEGNIQIWKNKIMLGPAVLCGVPTLPLVPEVPFPVLPSTMV